MPLYAYRFDKHRQLAFQSIAVDPQLADKLDNLIQQVRESVTME